ncbi:hypothetical protein [uncultured Maribacter sp.]|uniref:hypothetical protein n=1 Tax=uncultured Maribacter sp. TaxID=431308 RepID=UPI002623A7D6|nr:hypothetical protein [uncultured Maribacter sp.]
MKSKLSPLFCFLFFIAASIFSNRLYAQDKSVLVITSPNANTVWMLPNTVTLEWETTNIGSEKNIRFFLIRDEMVVQELGIFPNTGSATNIKLEKNIGKGNHYQVMGIELFPDDKYNIAKFATPFFSIEKEAKNPSGVTNQNIVAKQAVATVQPKETKAEKRKKKRLKKEKEKKQKAIAKQKAKAKEKITTTKTETANVKKETISAAPKPQVLREEFVGRNITYVKDLSFEANEISVYIWDHGRQDGDIVSIYLNGKPVLTKYYLTYWKKEIKIKIDPNKKNDLFLYAHNLGSAPPNTVSLKITDGTTTSEDIILNSDLKSCEAVSISVNK